MWQRLRVVATAAILCVGLGDAGASAQETAARLEIRNVTLNPVDGLLVVTGAGFGENPVVTLDGTRLDVLPGSSETVVSVVAPVSVISVAGTYRLTIVDLDRHVGDVFVVAVPVPSALVDSATGAAAAVTPAPPADTPTAAGPPATLQAPSVVSPSSVIEDATSPYRTAIGASALANNTGTGLGNTAAGHYTLYSNTTGGLNTGIGAWSLYSSQTGNYNTAAGYTSLWSNTSGSYNTALGNMSLYQNTIGQANTAVGSESLITATNGQSNTAVGISSLRSTSGSYNAALGAFAGYYATTGVHNVFLGANARGSASDTNTMRLGVPYDGAAGQNRTFIAGIRGTSVTNAMPVVIDANGQLGTADHSTTFGIGTSTPVTTLDVQAAANVHLGVRTGQADATAVELNAYNDGGAANIPMEFKATRFNFTPGNVGIGTTTPGSRLDVRGEIGSGDGALKNVVSYARYLDNPVGVFGTLSGHDLQVWANGSPQMAVTAAGNVGIGTVSPQYKLHVFGSIYATGSYLGSDRRLKRDVQDLRYGLREVLRLRPVSFGWKDPALGATTTTGLIAQEAEPIVPELVARAQDKDGMLSLNYVGLVPVLIKAVQEQQETLRAQQVSNEALKAMVAELQARTTELERQLRASTAQQK